MLALNDAHIAEPVVTATSLRLPRAMDWPNKITRAREFTAEFAPDWFSLQFVCYGYHRRGWVFWIAPRLQAIFNGVQRQIMFHELWIGMHRSAPLREKIEGLVQRSAVLGLARDLKPQVVHTNAEAYAAVLRRNGIEARALPVFSNIPVNPEPASLEILCAKSGVESGSIDRPKSWLFGMFGNIPPELKPEPLLSQLQAACAANGKQCVLIAFGKRGSGPEAQWKKLQLYDNSQIRFLTFGELTADDASSVIQNLDFGIATAPRLMLGKSGAAAAMREHGLPVIVPRDDVHFAGLSETDASTYPEYISLNQNLARGLMEARRPTTRNTVSTAAVKFIDDLQCNSNH